MNPSKSDNLRWMCMSYFRVWLGVGLWLFSYPEEKQALNCWPPAQIHGQRPGLWTLSFLRLCFSLPNCMMWMLLMSMEDAVMYNLGLPSEIKGLFFWLFSGQLANSTQF